MLIHYQYTDTELKQLLSTLTIIIDSREQENKHITDFFTKKKIPHLTQKLDVGDYSCMLPANPGLGIVRDAYFPISLERKNSLEELSNSFVSRERFENELLRSKGKRFILMVEESSGYEKIINHQYKTDYGEKAFLATLFTFTHRYGIQVSFIDKKYAGMFVYYQMYYFLREYLKNF